MKNRITQLIIPGLVLLAVIGITSSFITNPAGFLQRIAVILVVGAVIFFIVRRFTQANPGKREQRAFNRAAKRSKKRFMTSETGKGSTRKSTTLTPIKKTKKKSSTHLTVIEGKKGKKKDRASL